MDSPKASRSCSTSKTHANDRSMLPLRNLPGSLWLCCKFWKKSSDDPSVQERSNSNSSSSIDFQRRQDFSQGIRFIDELVRRRGASFREQIPDVNADEAKRLLDIITRLLERLENQPDIPAFGEEECLTCTTNRASMQTFPCGHKVLCKTCFLTTVQVALQGHQLPLRCVVCRSRVVRLKQQSAVCPVVVRKQSESPGSFFTPHTLSPLPPSGIRQPGYL